MTTTTTKPSSSPTIPEVAAGIRRTFDRGVTRPLEWRREQLDAMATMLRDGTKQLTAAMQEDLGKTATEAWTTEIGFVLTDIKHTKRHLKSWSKPRRTSVPLILRPGRATIMAEPLGMVLVLAPWNYPVQLLLSPIVAAIAAGNAVVAKPSELAPATSAALIELAAKYLDREAIAVIGGGVDEATALLAERFDHIFFTGSTKVGHIVMRAAAEQLTPVTLELGGKSPAIVTADADLAIAARRIAWGKFMNAGQTCVAPDYVLVDRSKQDRFVDHLRTSITEFFGANPQASSDYGRIISDRHHQRLMGLLDGEGAGAIAVGGTADAATRYIAPTVIVEPAPDSAIMEEEIFGPLLPILAVDDIDEAIAFVRSRPKPLALYVFSSDQETIDRTLAETSSGGVTVNHTLLHLSVPDLPFGGVGPSGMGAYHGQAGFEAFSHLKSVYTRPIKPDFSLLYPPYTKLKQWLLRRR